MNCTICGKAHRARLWEDLTFAAGYSPLGVTHVEHKIHDAILLIEEAEEIIEGMGRDNRTEQSEAWLKKVSAN